MLPSRMTRWTVVALVAAAIAVAGTIYLRGRSATISPGAAAREGAVGCSQAATAFRRRESYAWISLAARVVRLLPDEYGTYQHQRFVVRCPSGQTVLITNDVSVGSRVPLRTREPVVVHGEYIWNSHGGLIHFTHHGAANGGGWILYRGRVYAQVQDRSRGVLEARG